MKKNALPWRKDCLKNQMTQRVPSTLAETLKAGDLVWNLFCSVSFLQGARKTSGKRMGRNMVHTEFTQAEIYSLC